MNLRPPALLSCTCPPLINMPPVNALLAERISVPAPALTIPFEPVMTPPIVSVPPVATVTVRKVSGRILRLIVWGVVALSVILPDSVIGLPRRA